MTASDAVCLLVGAHHFSDSHRTNAPDFVLVAMETLDLFETGQSSLILVSSSMAAGQSSKQLVCETNIKSETVDRKLICNNFGNQ